MRSIVCHEPGCLEFESREAPIPGGSEVLVRIRSVGLCGTDFQIFAGRHPFLTYPRVMGHELGGEVVSAPMASNLRVGQIVAINPYLACSRCVACRNSKPNACVELKVLGVHVDGGMSDLLTVPESAVVDATGLSHDQAAMVEFLAIGAHAVDRARLARGSHVLVVGAGPIGVAVALFARSSGSRVTLTDRRPGRVRFSREALSFECCPSSEDLETEMAALTRGDMFDCVFDATGSLAAMRRSLGLVAHGGTLVLVGLAPGDVAFDDAELHKREATIVSSRNALTSDFERVIAAIERGEISTEVLHTHSVTADELPRRLPELLADADTVLKAIALF